MWVGWRCGRAPVQMWQLWAQSRSTCGRGGPSHGADVGGVGPVTVQMWQGWAQSRRICGQGEPSLGADVARLAMSRRRCGEPPSAAVVYAWASLPARRPADTAPSPKCRTSLTRAWMAKYVRSSWAGRGCTAVRSSKGSEVNACLLLNGLSLGSHGKNGAPGVAKSCGRCG
jgi:hypothetical protein